MSIIYNFIEQLSVESYLGKQIELSCGNETICISKDEKYYYFMLSKTHHLMSNLCREIVMVSERQHDFKIKKTNNELSQYLENKINKKEVKEVLEKDEQELIDLFEEKLKNNTKLSSIFLASKLSDNLKSKKSHKKSKI